jgi:hypothetical protein
MPIPLILAPVLAQLASKGLDLIGSAILAKGKNVVEKELGVDIEQSLTTEQGTEELRMAQMTHEEKLLEFALAEKKLDLNYYTTDAADRADARAREVAIVTNPDSGWLNRYIVSILALVVILGGGLILYFHSDNEVKFSVSNLMVLVLGYFFGSSRSSSQKDTAINNLSKVQ